MCIVYIAISVHIPKKKTANNKQMVLSKHKQGFFAVIWGFKDARRRYSGRKLVWSYGIDLNMDIWLHGEQDIGVDVSVI